MWVCAQDAEGLPSDIREEVQADTDMRESGEGLQENSNGWNRHSVRKKRLPGKDLSAVEYKDCSMAIEPIA